MACTASMGLSPTAEAKAREMQARVCPRLQRRHPLVSNFARLKSRPPKWGLRGDAFQWYFVNYLQNPTAFVRLQVTMTAAATHLS